MEAAQRPAHHSKFYSLRSVALQGPGETGGPKSAVGAVAAPGLLPRIGAAGQVAQGPASARGARRGSGEQAEPVEEVLEGEAIARLLRRRDLAVTEHAKVEAQMRKALEKLPQEEALRAEAASQADAQDRLALGVSEKLKVELRRIHDQAAVLRDLRRQLKDLDPDKKSQKGAKPLASAPWRDAGATAGFASARTTRSPAQPAAKSGQDAAAAHADGLDSFLENIAAELQQVTQAMGCDAPGADESRPQTTQTSGRATGSSLFEDAEIDLLRCGTASVARLRHPRGPEVLLDLRGGHVCSWRLADGRSAPARSVPLLWPSCLGQEGCHQHPWRLAVMDDSNNEPSITVSCGGDSTWWTVRRTLTVTSAGFTDAVHVQNVSDGSAQLTVTEAGPAEDLQGLAREMDAVYTAAELGTFQPRRVSSAAESWPISITLAPKESWSAAQRWAPRSGQ